MQLVAFVEDQFSVEDWPEVILREVAVKLMVGEGAACTMIVMVCELLRFPGSLAVKVSV